MDSVHMNSVNIMNNVTTFSDNATMHSVSVNSVGMNNDFCEYCRELMFKGCFTHKPNAREGN